MTEELVWFHHLVMPLPLWGRTLRLGVGAASPLSQVGRLRPRKVAWCARMWT